jgi:hypothetical protein
MARTTPAAAEAAAGTPKQHKQHKQKQQEPQGAELTAADVPEQPAGADVVAAASPASSGGLLQQQDNQQQDEPAQEQQQQQTRKKKKQNKLLSEEKLRRLKEQHDRCDTQLWCLSAYVAMLRYSDAHVTWLCVRHLLVSFGQVPCMPLAGHLMGSSHSNIHSASH